MIKQKKWFYILRPLLAVRWIEQQRGTVPMLFRALLVTIEDRPDLIARIEQLLIKKMAGDEMDEVPKDPVLAQFVETEIERLQKRIVELPSTPIDIEALNALFRETIRSVPAEGTSINTA
jgi:predicted nucleotidyltransferase